MKLFNNKIKLKATKTNQLIKNNINSINKRNNSNKIRFNRTINQ